MSTTVQLKDPSGTRRSYTFDEGVKLINADGSDFEVFTQGGSASIARNTNYGELLGKNMPSSSYSDRMAYARQELDRWTSVTLPAGSVVREICARQVVAVLLAQSTNGSDDGMFTCRSTTAPTVTTTENQDGTITVKATAKTSDCTALMFMASSCYQYGGGASSDIYLEVTYT